MTQKQQKASKGKPLSLSCVKDIDILASDFSFRFNSKSGKFQTSIGGYLTLMMGIISLGTLTTALMQYFQERDPVVSVSSEAGATFNEFNLYHESLWTPASISSGLSFPRTDVVGRFITMVWLVEESRFNSSTQKIQKRLVRKINSIPCKEVTDPLMRKQINDSVSLPGFDEIILCPDLKVSDGSIDDFKVMEDSEMQISRTISMKLYPCSLENPAECAQGCQLLGMGTNFAKISRLMKSDDFENPIKIFINRDRKSLDLGVTKIIKRTIQNAQVIDDLSRFTTPVLKLKFTKMGFGKSDFSIRNRRQSYLLVKIKSKIFFKFFFNFSNFFS